MHGELSIHVAHHYDKPGLERRRLQYMGVVEIKLYGLMMMDDDLMVPNMSGAADETLGEAGSESSGEFKPTLRMKLKVSGDDLIVYVTDRLFWYLVFTRDNNNPCCGLLFPLPYGYCGHEIQCCLGIIISLPVDKNTQPCVVGVSFL